MAIQQMWFIFVLSYVGRCFVAFRCQKKYIVGMALVPDARELWPCAYREDIVHCTFVRFCKGIVPMSTYLA
jgi:hypothetical protein